jgi:glycine/D-amino acid oxidase-like deaminating enzyme
MTASNATDVVVIGAGIVGCATAYFLAKAGIGVTLLERGDIGGAVSGASLACIGSHMVSREELPLLIAARHLWSELADELGEDVEFRRCGQLRFVAHEADLPVAREWIAIERKAGADVSLLAPEDVRRIVPALSGDIVAATWSPDDATVNPFLACRALVSEAQRLGARVQPHTAAIGIERTNGRVSAVLTRADRLPTRWIINASGPWAARVAAPLGLAVPIKPRKAQCLATVALPPTIPCVVGACESAGGVEAGYTQIQQAKSGQILFNTVLGGGLREDGAQDSIPEVDHKFVKDSVRTLLWLFPSLEPVEMLRSWVRFEAVTPDDRFVVGPVEGIDGFLMAAGDCGTGFTRAPMIGRLLTELILDGHSSLPLDCYALSRFPPARSAA